MLHRPAGVLVVSIDLNGVQGASPAAQWMTQTRLLQALGKYRLAASWAMEELPAGALLDEIRSSPARQEVALLGSADWTAAGRPWFAHELARRTSLARQQGLEISTLALAAGQPDQHSDLAVKHGLSVIRTQPSARGPWQPTSIRYGLWQMPITATAPASRGLYTGLIPGWALRRLIDRQIVEAGFCQLLITGKSLAPPAGGAWRRLDKTLRHVANRREQGRLAVHTLAEAANLLAARRQTAPACSVLRRAA